MHRPVLGEAEIVSDARRQAPMVGHATRFTGEEARDRTEHEAPPYDSRDWALRTPDAQTHHPTRLPHEETRRPDQHPVPVIVNGYGHPERSEGSQARRSDAVSEWREGGEDHHPPGPPKR